MWTCNLLFRTNQGWNFVPRSLPESHFVIQDLPQVVPIAQMNIERDIPAAAKEGRVIAEVHSFFEPQPRVVEGGVFIFRYILWGETCSILSILMVIFDSHNWPDTDCILILRNTMKSMDREVILALRLNLGPTNSPLTVENTDHRRHFDSVHRCHIKWLRPKFDYTWRPSVCQWV